MNNPIAKLIKLEEGGDDNGGADPAYHPNGAKSKAKSATKKKSEQTFSHPGASLKLNPKNFDWFLSGIDRERIENILKDEQSFLAGIPPQVKLEETFAMVRGQDGGHNDISNAFQNLNLLDMQDPNMEAENSELRRMAPGDESFEKALVRDAGLQGANDQTMFDHVGEGGFGL